MAKGQRITKIASKVAGASDDVAKIADDVAEARRLRRLEIEGSSTASPEAKARATAALDRQPTKNMTAEEWKAKEAARRENSQAGKDYRQKQAELQRQAQQQEYEAGQQAAASRKQDIKQRKEDVTNRRIERERKAMEAESAQAEADAAKTRAEALDVKNNEISPEQRAKNDALKKELTERKIAREKAKDGIAPPQEEVRDRQAKPLTAEERKQRGLGGQSKAEYDLQQKEAAKEAAQRQKEFDEAQKNINQQNRPLIQKTLDGAKHVKETLSGGWQAVKDTVTGATREANAQFATSYNQMVHDAGGSAADYIDIKGAGKLSKEYDSVKDAFNASGLGQKGTTAPNGSNPADIAAENAANGFNFDGIAEWAKENQLIVAGGLVAGTLLLTDD